jgi:hypothetical protein
MTSLARLPAAVARFKSAEEALVVAVVRAYPLGAIVGATLGRARIYGPVVGHGGTGYHRGYIGIKNEATGKERWFYAAERSLHDVEVVSTEAELLALRIEGHGVGVDKGGG